MSAEAVVPQDPGVNLAERVVCLQLSLSMVGTRVKVDPRKVRVTGAKGVTDVDAPSVPSEALSISKEVLQSDQLKGIARLHGVIRTYVRERSVPTVFLKGGMYFVKSAFAQAVNEGLEAFEAELDTMVDAFIDEYQAPDGLIARAKERLGSLFDPEDYPPASRVRAAFGIEWSFMQFQTPTSLRSVSKELFERESAKAAEQWQAAAQEIRAYTRALTQELVNHVVDRLTPDDDGNPKVFKASMVERLQEFVSLFPFKDATDDQALARQVAVMRDVMKGVQPEVLRETRAMRERVLEGMTAVKVAVDKLVEEAPGRLVDI